MLQVTWLKHVCLEQPIGHATQNHMYICVAHMKESPDQLPNVKISRKEAAQETQIMCFFKWQARHSQMMRLITRNFRGRRNQHLYCVHMFYMFAEALHILCSSDYILLLSSEDFSCSRRALVPSGWKCSSLSQCDLNDSTGHGAG